MTPRKQTKHPRKGAVQTVLYAFIDSIQKFGVAIDMAQIIGLIRFVPHILNVSLTMPDSDLASAAGRIYLINKDETDVNLTMVAA